MQVTGERVVEEKYVESTKGAAILAMHKATYEFALKYCRGKQVLDFGCGTGYGSRILAEVAAAVDGVDVSEESLSYARTHYARDNLRFIQIDHDGNVVSGAELRGYDVVTSFQVIEHINDVPAYLQTVAKSLKPNGTLIVATPDRRTRLFRFQRPWNRWHVREYDPEALENALREQFHVRSVVEMHASQSIEANELARYRITRLLTLPFTLPGIPDRLRVFFLNLLASLTSSGRRTGRVPVDVNSMMITLTEGRKPSLNIVIVAERKSD